MKLTKKLIYPFVITITTVVVGTVVALVFFGGEEGSQDKESQDNSNIAGQVNTTITLDEKNITINEIKTRYDLENSLLIPNPGNQIVKINLSLKNTTNQPVDYSYNNFYLLTENGLEVYPLFVKHGTVSDFLYDGVLGQSGQIRGSIFFEIERDATEVDLVFVPQFLEEDKNVVFEDIF